MIPWVRSRCDRCGFKGKEIEHRVRREEIQKLRYEEAMKDMVGEMGGSEVKERREENESIRKEQFIKQTSKRATSRQTNDIIRPSGISNESDTTHRRLKHSPSNNKDDTTIEGASKRE